MKKYVLHCCTFFCFLAVAMSSFVQAEGVRYFGDNSHTEVIFKINHLGFSNTYGRFTNVESEIVYDESDPSKSQVSATVHIDSLDMGHGQKTKHVKSSSFFNVKKFPTMEFKSTSVKVMPDKKMEVTGNLTLLGVSKPITLLVQINKIGKHPIYRGSDAIGFSATGSLDRTQWGLDKYAPKVGKEVTFNIEFEGTSSGADYENKFIGNKKKK